MQTTLKRHLTNRFPELVNQKFLVACSGGLDSVVLVNLLAKLKLDFIIAHCNFQLRGEESDLDEAFVQELGKTSKRKVLVKKFDTEAYASEQKLSIQLAARELRYHWFCILLKEYQLAKIVTAHHKDDNLETFLINLSRGSGLEGLKGIPEKNNLVARPLLVFSREDILSFAEKENVKWREDESNQEVKYLRNKVRHEMVSVIKSIHPSFLQNFETSRSHLEESSALLKDYQKFLTKKLLDKQQNRIKISIKKLKKYKPIKAYLYLLLKDYGFTQWEAIVDLIDAISGKAVYSKTYRLSKDRKALFLEPIPSMENNEWCIPLSEKEISLPVPLTIQLVDRIESVDKNILYADKETLEEKVVVRKYRKGDYFYPFGMRGKKKISKFFKDQKYSLHEKENQWLLTSGNEIIWVVGKRADDRFKVTPETKNIVKISLNI
ncbi:tRNA lysidine(34) synthetase TilS [Eudoraea chungangensis]|uniref:tRNA lysidine(34) synthetase TilS n=1 Tax=Eudoraea chungangensis TaxID=1481905 RepID=UPI0023EB798E|nr:tRNA lysidine(34) synthetase TilS [Eudoraea chungangensis]